MGLLAQTYWMPVYKYLRIRWRKPREDAEDLTQEFFAKAMGKGYFERYDLLGDYATGQHFGDDRRICHPEVHSAERAGAGLRG